MRYALIEGNLVTNIILWDGETEADFGSAEPVKIADDSAASIGWSFEGGKFVEPKAAK